MSYGVGTADRARLAHAIERAFGRLTFLAGLTGDELLMLADEADVRGYRPGERIFEQGSDGDELHFVLEGRVDLLERGIDGRERPVARVEPGDAFGEIGFMLGVPRTLAAVNGPTEGVHATLSRLDFDRLVELNPRIGCAVFRDLVETIAARMNELTAADRDGLLGLASS